MVLIAALLFLNKNEDNLQQENHVNTDKNWTNWGRAVYTHGKTLVKKRSK